MKTKIATIAIGAILVGLSGSHVAALADASIGFDLFTTGASIDGQKGWGALGPCNNGNPLDEEIVDDGGDNVWRVSNACINSGFGSQPFAPRPGGIPDSDVDAVNSNPGEFAGESSTGAKFNRFFAQFSFTSATGGAQPGLSINVSADSGQGGRHGLVAIEDNGSTGIDLRIIEVDNAGNFLAPTDIATDLSYSDEHTLGIEILFADGADNDVINYYVDGALVHSGPSWEEFYRNFQAALHPNNVPVQTLQFRLSGKLGNQDIGDPAPGTLGNGFYIDDVKIMPTQVDHFACYVVKEEDSLGTQNVDLEDQFGKLPSVEIKKAKRLCAPVDKNGEGVIDGLGHLVCYEVKKGHDPDVNVEVTNQFGRQELEVKKLKRLCVPSTKEVIEDSGGDGDDDDDDDD